jgi:beta-N-acetylhexosaminidase
VTRARHRHPWQTALIEAMGRAHPDVTVVDLGWPSAPLPGARTWITTWGASRASAEVVAELLTRKDPSHG